MLRLSENQITEIYNDWKEKPLNLQELIKQYCIAIPEGAVHYSLEVSFFHGDGYYTVEGIATAEQHQRFKRVVRNQEVEVGGIDGTASQISLSSDHFFFSSNRDRIRRYLNRNGMTEFPACPDGPLQSFTQDHDNSDDETHRADEVEEGEIVEKAKRKEGPEEKEESQAPAKKPCLEADVQVEAAVAVN